MPSIPNAYLRPLQEALLDAYPTRAQLAMMLQFELEKVLDTITTAHNIRAQIFELLQESQRDGWTTDLVVAARRDNDGNEKLRAFAETLAQAPTAGTTQGNPTSTPPPNENVDLNLPPAEELESIIKAAYGFLELDWWVAQLQTIGKQVCCIEIRATNNQGKAHGTGFLVGADLVLTNYHVMEPVILGEDGQATDDGWWARREDVTLTFDYKRLADRKTVNPGVAVALAPPKQWLVDSSDSSDLDYALIRLAEPVGNERGWIKLPESALLEADMPLFIVQHPDGRPIELAIDKVLGWKEKSNRVRYRTNTQGGSSGSPCFTAKWELVALHHAGDGRDAPTYNQGIPISALVNQWKRNTVWDKYIQEPPTTVAVQELKVNIPDATRPQGNGGQGGVSPTRRRTLERRLRELEEELEATETQRGFAIAGAEKVQLDRQINHLITQIDEIKAELESGGSVTRSVGDSAPGLQTLIAGLNRHKLLNILLKLSGDEFQVLLVAFDKISYDHLGGDNSGRKTLELVLWAERHNSFAKLIEVAYTLYPDIGWKV